MSKREDSRKSGLGGQIRSFVACADPLPPKKTREMGETGDAMTDMRIRVSLEESHPNTCSSNHAIVRAVHSSPGTSI